jgi:glycosyltransferase involved in cell wall biosynthesis
LAEVSVIIPSYNHARYIASAVESVLKQTWEDFELIIIDDGSQDQSLEILNQFTDSRIHILKQENQGAHAAINRGLQESSGRFLAILNSDDQYHPERLSKTIDIFTKYPQTGLVGSFLEIINQDDVVVGTKHGYMDCNPWLLENPYQSFRAGKDLSLALLTENYLSTTSNFVFTRQCLDVIGKFNPLRYTHDWDFALRVSNQFPIHLVEEPLVRYRIHPGNTIRENHAAMVFEICWILAMHLPGFYKSGKFSQERYEIRASQLLHSIYTFQCDKVLSVMLLLQLDQNNDHALSLLNPTNPERHSFIRYIQNNIPVETSKENISLYRRIRRLLSPYKASVNRLLKHKP